MVTEIRQVIYVSISNVEYKHTYTHRPSFKGHCYQDNVGKPIPKWQTILDFTVANDGGCGGANRKVQNSSRITTTRTPTRLFHTPRALAATQQIATTH